MNESISFPYDELDPETRAFIQQKTDEIHGQLKRTAEGIIRIGQWLAEVKEKLPHGQFLSWIQTEFEMSHPTAWRFMQVAEKFAGKSFNLKLLPVSVLYELAAPSMPETVVESVLSGEISPTMQAVREARKAEQQAQADKEVLQQQLQQAEQQASAAKQHLHADQEALQQLLEQERSTAQVQLATLTSEIERLQGEIARHSTPLVKEIPVIPAEVSRQMEALRAIPSPGGSRS